MTRPTQCLPPVGTEPNTMHTLKNTLGHGRTVLLMWTGESWTTPGATMTTSPEKAAFLGWEYDKVVRGVMASPTGRKRLCRDCADFAQDGICPNDGKPCSTTAGVGIPGEGRHG